eukprot:596719-Pleurochrysis_carterae.AAC.1
MSILLLLQLSTDPSLSKTLLPPSMIMSIQFSPVKLFSSQAIYFEAFNGIPEVPCKQLYVQLTPTSTASFMYSILAASIQRVSSCAR